MSFLIPKTKSLIRVVVGDKSKIEAEIKTLGYTVKYIDGDGNIIMSFLKTSTQSKPKLFGFLFVIVTEFISNKS